MSNDLLPELCGQNGCRLLRSHTGEHDPRPASAWGHLGEKDKVKLTKAGWATPRGGAKGAYQNHVDRSSRVIIPYKRLNSIDLNLYPNHVICLLPTDYFAPTGVAKPEFMGANARVRVGTNAFVLYRTHADYEQFPPPADWTICKLFKDGAEVEKWGAGVESRGHYVLRLSRQGQKGKRFEGKPQGIFAPEYASPEMNYLSRCILAWLIIRTVQSPFVTADALHLQAIMRAEGILADSERERKGVIRHGQTACPLCGKLIHYNELHETLKLDEVQAMENAAEQVLGATRSTIVNLFHLDPLYYGVIEHVPSKVAWGHAICNTKLGQRRCQPLQEMIESGDKLGILLPDRVETFAWISRDREMIRSPLGSVWIRLCGDEADAPLPSVDPLAESVDELGEEFEDAE